MKTIAVRFMWLSSAVGATLLAAGVLTWGQQLQVSPAQAQQDTKDASLGKESTQGVYVSESSTAVNKLVNAQKMERLKEWAKAADYYQEVLQKYNDKVVPTGVDKDDVIDQYGNIKDKVRQALAQWPREGVDVYKARYESQADAILNNARPDDLDALYKVFDTYFITDAGRKAGLALMELGMESGEFESSARVGDELLKWHPGLGEDRPAIMFQTGLAAYYGGQTENAQAMLQALKTQYPAARGTVRGAEQDLADALAHELTATVASAAEEGPDSWKMSIGGGPSRGQISTAKGRPQARLYEVNLVVSKTAQNPNPAFQQQLDAQQKSEELQGYGPGVLPSVDRGELYFQDGRRMYAVNLDSGLPLPGWAQSYPGTGQYTLPDFNGVPQTRQMCVTLTDQDALAIMGQTEQDPQTLMMLQQQNQPIPQGSTRLVCLSRQTGKPRWTTRMSEMPQAAQELRTAQMIGSPLVVGQNVVVMAQANLQGGYINCYCVCFDLESGKFRWKCSIAGASTSMPYFGAPMMANQGDAQFSHPAYADGRVFVQTNIGAIASIDAYNGSIAWLDLYPSNAAVTNGNPMMMNPWGRPAQESNKPFAGNPVIVSQGKVFAIPADSDNLLIYDASTGAELKRISLKDFATDEDLAKDMDSPLTFNMLVAVDGDTVTIGGAHDKIAQLCCFDWTKYTDADPALEWASAPMQSMVGRCFVTTDSIFVPTADRLIRIDRQGGIIQEDYPPEDRTWDTEANEGPGNVLVTTDRVVVAGFKHVEVYADLSAARQKLDAAVAAAPTDPNPRLEYAEVMFVSGHTDVAATRLDEAIQLLGGKDHLSRGLARDRFFNDAMAFARKLSASQKKQPDIVDRFFDRAAVSAADPAQFVDYYLTRGAYVETLAHGDAPAASAAAAVKLYQQILSDAALRVVSRPDDKGRNTDAGALAAEGIDRMIAVDPTSYQPYSAQADDALAKATDAKSDGPTFQNIARMYPNSAAATKALLAAADAYESANQSTSAIQVLRQMYFERKNDALAPQLLEGMARNYLKRSDHSTSDRLSAAAASLSRAVALSPQASLQRPLPLPDGQVLRDQSLSQALAEVRQERGEESARMLPDFHLPTPPVHPTGHWPTPFAAAGPADVIANTRALLVPVSEFSRPDRVVTQDTNSQLCIFPAMQPDPLVKVDVAGNQLVGSAWSGNTLVTWGPMAVFSIKDGTNQLAWSMKISDLPEVQLNPNDADSGDNDPNRISDMGQARFGLQVVGNGQMVAQNMLIRGNNVVVGGRVFQGQFGNEVIVQVRPVGDRIVCMTSAGRVVALDAATGKLAWQARPGTGANSGFVANEDFTVVRAAETAGTRLTCYDTYTGHELGEKSFPNSAPMPTNMALAADGTLVYTVADRIALKDLFKPWGDQPDKQSPPQPGQAASFFNGQSGAPAADQLVISEGRIVALWNDNPFNNNGQAGSVVVRVFSLDTAQPIALHYSSAQGNGSLPVQLPAGHTFADVSLRTVGSRLYVVGGTLGISSFDLDHPGNCWVPMQGIIPPNATVSNALVGRNHIVLLTEPQDVQAFPGNMPPGMMIRPRLRMNINPNPPGAPNVPQAAQPNAPTLGIYAFARYPGASGDESGRIDYSPAVQPSCAINEPTNIQAIQGVDGGLCYLSGDSKLHLLHGTAQ